MAQDTTSPTDFCFVHFTDTHIMDGGVDPITQLDTSACLRQVIDVLRTLEPRPAFAVIGGDLVSPGVLEPHRDLSPEEFVPSYELLQSLLQPLTFPIYMLLGNHDNRPAFYQVIKPQDGVADEPYYYSFDHQGWHFVALDSVQPGEVGGYLDATQLAWLRDDLDAHLTQPTLVLVHHHPLPVGDERLDSVRLQNGEELLSMLRQYATVRWLLCGHVHLEQVVACDGVTMLTTPSTCYQVFPLRPIRQRRLPGPPAFRVISVKGVELSTRVIYLHQEQMRALAQPLASA